MSNAAMITPEHIAKEIMLRIDSGKITMGGGMHPFGYKVILISKWTSSWEEMNAPIRVYGNTIPKEWDCHTILAYPDFAGIATEDKAMVSCGGLECIVVYQYRIVHDDYMIKAWVKKYE